jgi:hypothetical protein
VVGEVKQGRAGDHRQPHPEQDQSDAPDHGGGDIPADLGCQEGPHRAPRPALSPFSR